MIVIDQTKLIELEALYEFPKTLEDAVMKAGVKLLLFEHSVNGIPFDELVKERESLLERQEELANEAEELQQKLADTLTEFKLRLKEITEQNN